FYAALGCGIFHDEMHALARCEQPDDLGVDPRNRLELAGPVFRIVRPGKPGGLVPFPLGGYAVLELMRSFRHVLFSVSRLWCSEVAQGLNVRASAWPRAGPSERRHAPSPTARWYRYAHRQRRGYRRKAESSWRRHREPRRAHSYTHRRRAGPGASRACDRPQVASEWLRMTARRSWQALHKRERPADRESSMPEPRSAGRQPIP